MKKSRFSEAQIVSILKKHEAGMKTIDLCREHGISEQTFYDWKAKYGGMTVRELKRLKELESENARLKKMFADISLENYALKDLISKKSLSCCSKFFSLLSIPSILTNWPAFARTFVPSKLTVLPWIY